VLADHEPTMAALATGAVQIHHEGLTTSAGIHGGFLQIFRNQVDAAHRPGRAHRG
jgi:F0F1-type ATP synthase epsilon subunit